MMRPLRLACCLCAGLAAIPAAAGQPLPDRSPAWAMRRERLVAPGPLLQLDATALMRPAPQMPEPPPQRRPMFSDGWTRDGFGGQQRGWR